MISNRTIGAIDTTGNVPQWESVVSREPAAEIFKTFTFDRTGHQFVREFFPTKLVTDSHAVSPL